MGVTASSSSSWAAGSRTGVRSLPSVAVPGPVPGPELELRGVLALEVVRTAMAAVLLGAGAGSGVESEPKLCYHSRLFIADSLGLKTAAAIGSGPTGRAAVLHIYFTTPLPWEWRPYRGANIHVLLTLHVYARTCITHFCRP